MAPETPPLISSARNLSMSSPCLHPCLCLRRSPVAGSGGAAGHLLLLDAGEWDVLVARNRTDGVVLRAGNLHHRRAGSRLLMVLRVRHRTERRRLVRR